jgi:hypothetical protein
LETALYYPHIRVPQTAWFTQVLLYWDRAAAIVPIGLERDEEYLGPHMSELIRSGLVQRTYPDEVLAPQSVAFELRFLELLKSRPVPAEGDRRWMPVHDGKLGGYVFEQLERGGLARRQEGPGWGSWWKVEEGTANLYLAYLAGAICGVREGFFPITDNATTIADLAPPDGDAAARLRTLRYTAITGALPAPTGPVPPADLRAFKEQHHDELRRLRVHLDGRLADLASVEDDGLLRARTDSVLQEISDEVAVLREKMARRDWPRIALVGVGGVFGSALALASTVASGGSALALGLAVGGGVASLGGASYQALEIVRSTQLDRRAPLIYAALAQTELRPTRDDRLLRRVGRRLRRLLPSVRSSGRTGAAQESRRAPLSILRLRPERGFLGRWTTPG